MANYWVVRLEIGFETGGKLGGPAQYWITNQTMDNAAIKTVKDIVDDGTGAKFVITAVGTVNAATREFMDGPSDGAPRAWPWPKAA